MQEFSFKQIDVFTELPFWGNPVAVVFDADGLSDDEMQKIARWTNLSETTFVQSSDRADYKLKIFTPGMELPFAGHPTVGSAHAVRETGIISVDKTSFVQECKAGLIPISIKDNKNIIIKAPKIKIIDKKPDANLLLKSTNSVPLIDPIIIDVGPVWMAARLEDFNSLYSIEINSEILMELSMQTQSIGLNVYAVDRENKVHIRSFAPLIGILEDPVCGSGNIAIAHHIKTTCISDIVGHSYVARQGAALKRDGRVFVSIQDDDIFIGGSSVTVIQGKIKI